MAYDRYDTRRGRNPDDYRGRPEDRGFFEKAGDEIASWFGDEDAERRRRQDERSNPDRGWDRERADRQRANNRDYDRGYGRDYDRDRGFYPEHGYLRSEYDPGYEDRGGYRASNRPRSNRSERNQDRGYWRGTGDGYRGHGGSYYGDHASGYGDLDYGSDSFGTGVDYPDRLPPSYDYAARRDQDRRQRERWRDWDRNRDEFRGTSYYGAREYDRDYNAWRQRHLDELDRDYDQYRRENQERFGSDFGSWREERMRKRNLLGQIREHMEVVGANDEHVGTVDCVRGDRIVLTKSDSPDDHHHSIPCSMLERIEGDKVVLNIDANEVKNRWRDDETDRALFQRENESESGPHNLDRSFAGTYR